MWILRWRWLVSGESVTGMKLWEERQGLLPGLRWLCPDQRWEARLAHLVRVSSRLGPFGLFGKSMCRGWPPGRGGPCPSLWGLQASTTRWWCAICPAEPSWHVLGLMWEPGSGDSPAPALGNLSGLTKMCPSPLFGVSSDDLFCLPVDGIPKVAELKLRADGRVRACPHGSLVRGRL